jgi:TrmH family RNA methyltransferase
MLQITSEILYSLQNPRVKQIVKWRDRSDRDRDQVVLIEGYRALLRALSGGYPVHEVYICPGLFQGENEGALLTRLQQQGAKVFQTSEAVFRKMAYRDRPEGLLGIGPQRHRSLSELKMPEKAGFFLVAEQTEKPGNLGTIMRTADAVQVDGLILCDSRTDLYNPNVVRASTGNLFTLPIAEADSRQGITWLKENGLRIYATSPHAGELFTEVDMTAPLAIVVGAEQFGLSETWLEAADQKLRLPMLGQADSLNVATATALLLYECLRQRIKAGMIKDPGPVPENTHC